MLAPPPQADVTPRRVNAHRSSQIVWGSFEGTFGAHSRIQYNLASFSNLRPQLRMGHMDRSPAPPTAEVPRWGGYYLTYRMGHEHRTEPTDSHRSFPGGHLARFLHCLESKTPKKFDVRTNESATFVLFESTGHETVTFRHCKIWALIGIGQSLLVHIQLLNSANKSRCHIMAQQQQQLIQVIV